MLASSLVLLALAFRLTVAQNLSIPSTWRVSGFISLSFIILVNFHCAQDPTTSLSLSERVSIAQNCIDTLTGVLNTSTGSFSGKHCARGHAYL